MNSEISARSVVPLSKKMRRMRRNGNYRQKNMQHEKSESECQVFRLPRIFFCSQYKRIIFISILIPWFIFFGGVTLFLYTLPSGYYSTNVLWLVIILFVFLTGLTFWKLAIWHDIKRKKNLDQTLNIFFNLHPECKEILEVEENGDSP